MGYEVGPAGRMAAGAYSWCPPGVMHGPFGTPLPGKLQFYRSVGGPLATEYSEQEVDFNWCPGECVILPPLLAQSTVDSARQLIERDDY